MKKYFGIDSIVSEWRSNIPEYNERQYNNGPPKEVHWREKMVKKIKKH